MGLTPPPSPVPLPGDLPEVTPWEFAKQLLALGFSKAHITERLVAEKGLSRADAILLLTGVEEPSATPDEERSESDLEGEQATSLATTGGFNLGPPLGIGLAFGGLILLAGSIPMKVAGLGMFLFGAYRAITSFGAHARPPVVDPSRLVKLPADATAARCPRHPDLASIGTCTRCGSFACRACAPFRNFPGAAVCLPCDSLPATRRSRVEDAQHQSATACFASAALWMFPGILVGMETGWWAYVLSVAGLAAGILGALGLVQWFVRSIWPALGALGLSLVFIVPAFSVLGRAFNAGFVCAFLPSWLLLNVVLFTLASNHRGRIKALEDLTV